MQTEPSKAQPPNRKHRRFQFRLRTLLIGVTLLAIPCGDISWQARIARERLSELGRRVDLRVVGIDGSDKEGVIRWFRRVLGDKPIATVMMQVGTEQAELERICRLFPEARVDVWTPAMPTSLYR